MVDKITLKNEILLRKRYLYTISVIGIDNLNEKMLIFSCFIGSLVLELLLIKSSTTS